MIGSPVAAVRLAVFDVAGTTVLDDDAVTTSLLAAVHQRVLVSRANVLAVMGLPKPVAIAQLLSAAGLQPGELDAAVAEVHEDFRERLIARYRDGALSPVPDVEFVFGALREAGISVVLDTGFSRDILDLVLAQLGWSNGLVKFSVASDEVARGRPYPDLIHLAMALSRVAEPAMVAKIGDTPADLEQGLSARCGHTVGVTYGTHTRSQLARPGVHVIDRLRDLLPILGVPSS